MKAEIEWHAAEAGKPDTDTTVLVGFEDGDCECGYFDSESECWRNFAGVRFNEPVHAWADLPRVPSAQEVTA